VVDIGDGVAVVMAGGVGYQVFLTERTIAGLPPLGVTVDIRVRQVVRENEIALYGFDTANEKRLFELLTGVTGLGPRLAMALLNALGDEGVIAAILASDYKPLVRAQGVGQKLAQRIVVELVEKVREESLLGRIGKGKAAVGDDVIEALVSLGIRRTDAEKAASFAREQSESSDTAALLPIALKFAGKA
jgi:Holliday junction DNA helicase RuvA